MDDVRKNLEELRRARGDDYASLARLLGRNPAYVHQFVHRGTPRTLAESDRKRLARYYGVDETVLGGPAQETPAFADVVRIDVAASAGPGALVEDRRAGRLRLDPALVRSLGARAEALSAIRVSGDSMFPTLADGDEILVNGDDAAGGLRDGIYVLRAEGALVVKRLALGADRRIIIRSDNPAWPDWADFEPETLAIIGRVVWVSRRLA